MYSLAIHFVSVVAAQCPAYGLTTGAGPHCGILGQAGAIARALSENGITCGDVQFCNGDLHAYVQFPGGPVVPITTLGGLDYRRAIAVNSLGVVVGWVDTNPRSFRYHNGAVTWFEPLLGDTRSEVEAINEQGVAAGASSGDLGPRATFWIGTTPTILALPNGRSSVGRDINESGQICGWMGVHPYPSFGATPFIWNSGVTTSLPLPPQAASSSGNATAINNLGDACGYYYVYNEKLETYTPQGCAWIGGELIELGLLPGLVGTFPLDINDAGEIIGYCTEETGVAIAPFLWRDGVMHDLNDLIPTGSPFVYIAWAINNRGQIAGQGVVGPPDQHSVAFLLTPALPSHVGDTNCDDSVNVLDLLAVINHWNPPGPVGGDPVDLNRDNKIDHLDLLQTIFHWGQ